MDKPVGKSANSTVDAVFALLRSWLGERVTTVAAAIEAHGRSGSYHAAHPSDIVASSETTEGVAAIVGTCAKHGIAIVPNSGKIFGPNSA